MGRKFRGSDHISSHFSSQEIVMHMPRKYSFQGSWHWPQPQSDPPPSIPRVKRRSILALESVSWGKRAGVSHLPWCPPEVEEAGMMKRQGIGSPTPVLLVWEGGFTLHGWTLSIHKRQRNWKAVPPRVSTWSPLRIPVELFNDANVLSKPQTEETEIQGGKPKSPC